MTSARVLRRPGKPHLARHRFDTAHGAVSVWRCDWPEYDGVPFARVGPTPAKAYEAARIVALEWQRVADRARRPHERDLTEAHRYFAPYFAPDIRPSEVVQVDASPAHSWWRQLLNKI